jgi:RNase P subunit RPR2
MLSKLVDAMFGCRHDRYSFPLTVRPGARRNGSVARAAGTYVTCLDCGKEFRYDWQQMKVVRSQPEKAARSLVTNEAA